ncbi:MAG: zf-HC2 domain-containing protein [Gemmatimonadota bacterium]
MTEPTSGAGLDREVAGLSCRDVLDGLSEYLDGALEPGERARVEAHLRGCDHCERFGGRVAAVIATLRRSLEPVPLSAEQREALTRRLRSSGAIP